MQKDEVTTSSRNDGNTVLPAVFCPTDKKATMIKENEIRVGNTFYFPFHNQNVSIIGYAKIEKDDSFKVQFETNGGILLEPLSVLNTIALTEDILLKSGFKTLLDYWYFYEYIDGDESNYFAIKYDMANNLFSHHTSVEDTHPLIYVYNLHQLQNLFYCLTGFELSVVANGS